MVRHPAHYFWRSSGADLKKQLNTIHDYMHTQYLSGAQFKEYKNLDWAARSMLDKTTIVKNIERAKSLRKLCNKEMKNVRENKHSTDDYIELYKLLLECYETIVDDVMILSAFEILMKRRLLAKGYVIHNIIKPNELKNIQKKRPVHRRTICSQDKKNIKIEFSDNTLGIGLLLNKGYIERIKVPESFLECIDRVRKRRNLVHFHNGYAFDLDDNLINFVEYLNKAIPAYS